MAASRVEKTLLNMKVNMVTYFGSIVIAFFTRKVLLDHLGDEFIGLTSTMNSLLGFLNLAELGVGASIAYFLYKPLYDDDRSLVCETISIMGHLYRRIAMFILSAGVVCSCFLPMMFGDSEFSWAVIYYCFYGQLFTSLLGYFVNYKAATIFGADQRQYLVNAYFQVTQFVVVVLQAVMAWATGSYTIYITISVLFTIVNSVILNWKFAKVYPWVVADLSRGKDALKRRPEVMQYVRRVFLHQFGSFVNNSALPLVIYGYATLSVVTLYGNYALLNRKLSGFVYSMLSGTDASIGNLVAEGNPVKTYDCYRELFSAKFFVISILSLLLWRFNSAFIAVWLGPEYVLSSLLVGLICADIGLNLLRSTTDQFLTGFGLKADVWVPMCRIATLPLMALAGKAWGLTGILVVPVIFQLTFAHIWKPIYLYHSGFHRSLGGYVRLFVVNSLPVIVAFFLTMRVMMWFGYDGSLPDTWAAFLLESGIFSITFIALALALSWPVNSDLRWFVAHRLLHQIRSILH